MKRCFTILMLLAVHSASAAAHDPEAIAEAYLHERLATDITVDLRRKYTDAHNGVTHLYFMQQFKGLELAERDACIHIDRHGKIIRANGIVEALNAAPAAARRAAEIPATEAVQRAADHLGFVHVPEGVTPIRKAWFNPQFQTIHTVWNFNLKQPDLTHWWDVHVDVYSGEVLRKTDWVHNSRFNTWKFPILSPDHGPRTTFNGRPAPNASPFGWHDSDGAAGPEFFDTRGNNAHAQDDLDGNNSGGMRPHSDQALFFNESYLPGHTTRQNLRAAIVHAWYVNNLMHDIHYQYGFTEPAGNFQANNYGKGGFQGDQVMVDVQDGSSINNASFSAVPEGFQPRMQLHLWQGFFVSMQIQSPATISGAYRGSGATFGDAFPTNGLTANVVAALDPPDPPLNSTTDACSAITNGAQLAGNIALIDRGECFFVDKIKHAQNAGAIAVIVANHLGEQLVTMSGTDSSITIPSMFVSQSDGAALRAELNAGNPVRVTIASGPRRDSALDSGIIVHEYGHGVSIRLTGGPHAAGCLSGLQSSALGEGWSDWWGLVLTHQPGDQRTISRGIGTYVAGQPPNGSGIRSLPYNTNMAVNNLTYADFTTRSQEHSRGEIWCATLWDLYWDLIDRYGYDPDVYRGHGGNNLALQLVMDGLKLQPCNPTYLDARDAILLADRTNYEGSNQCLIWRCFARRGMGVNAFDGGTDNSTSIIENFTIPLGCESDMRVQLTPPAVNTITLDSPTVPGATYQLEGTDDLVNPVWTTIGLPVTALRTNTQFTATPGAGAGRHFRVTLQLSP